MAFNLYRFPGSSDATVGAVGGKGWSLIKMAGVGMPVPPGFVLPAEFFTAWIERLKTTAAWQQFLQSMKEVPGRTPALPGLETVMGSTALPGLAEVCNDLKAQSWAFEFTDEQEKAVQEIVDSNTSDLFAVRSSSPEEDLEGASFAGGYETILGVTPKKLHGAIKKAFASCLDNRVVIYKREHGFDATNPQIAVVVQKQVRSDVAGVGFSLNPVTNNFDEAVFNANWGLGESVVSGMATPDTFVVDKNNKKVLERNLGKKEMSVWLQTDGDTEERPDPRHEQLTLTDEQLVELTNLIAKVEHAYDKPIDIEWAYENNNLYLLQARPITTYIPLPPDMVTKPGEQKRLYIDFTISTQGITKPMSVMGTSVMREVKQRVTKFFGVKDATDCAHAVAWLEAGRLYLNLSNFFNVAPKDKVLNVFMNMDPLAAKTIESVNWQEYKAEHTDKHVPWHLMFQMPEVAIHIFEARTRPEQASRHVNEKVERFFVEVHELGNKDLPLPALIDQLIDLTIYGVIKHAVPLVITSRIALGQIKEMFPDLEDSELQKLERALPNNVTTEMGLELYEASQVLPPDLDAGALRERLVTRDLPPAFLEAWDEFIRHYGHRGAIEIDVAATRFRDDPGVLIEQLIMLRNSSSADDNPQERFDKAARERHRLLESLSKKLDQSDPSQIKRLHSLFTVVEELGGLRETHKFCVVMALDLIRQRLLRDAAVLVQEGRLQTASQIFDLTLDDLKEAQANRALDLLARGKVNRELPDRLSRVPQLPTVFDSRGKVLRPPRPPMKPGEVLGTAISPGVARGPVKVLHTSDEKPLLRGEILVARATDPGWTPLFVNAAAVILEVGGMLQHGALVAREYGLPCVSGIENATSLWEDGTIVEVDGSAGVVRVVR